ncbi:GlgC family sugar phosphate nucleotidyltransferase [Paraburkholderia aspalathi]
MSLLSASHSTSSISTQEKFGESFPLIETDTIISSNSTIGSGSWIRRGTSITRSIIHESVFIGFRCKIATATIAAHCQIASLTHIGRPNGPPVVLEEAVWIGAAQL